MLIKKKQGRRPDREREKQTTVPGVKVQSKPPIYGNSQVLCRVQIQFTDSCIVCEYARATCLKKNMEKSEKRRKNCLTNRDPGGIISKLSDERHESCREDIKSHKKP